MEMPSDSELFRAQARIWNHTLNFVNSMSLKCAIELDIPDIINNHGAPMPFSNLVEALQINRAKAHSIYRLMRILIHSGFFVKKKISKTEEEEEEEEEGYLLAPPSYLLLKDNPLSVTPFLSAMLDPLHLKPWPYMSEWFKTGDSMTFETAYGVNFWDYAAKQPNPTDFFNDGMASDARLISSVLIDKCKDIFTGIYSLVDVGGGTGTLAKAIADAFPHMKCSAFDLPHVVANLEGSKNFSFVAGSMFEAIPPADAVLLKWILHDWGDEECVKILKQCKAAITQTKEKVGKVIIIEMVVDDQKKFDNKSVETQLFFDMMMMVFSTGKERNEKEWAKLIYDAGFSYYKITPTFGLRSLIEVFP